MASRQEKWLGQAPDSSPHTAPAGAGNGKASCPAHCSWDFVAQGCQDPPEAVVGKDLRDGAFTSTLPTLHHGKNWGKLANINDMGMRNVPELGMQQVGATLSSEETRKAFYWDCGFCLSWLSAVSQDVGRDSISSTDPSRLWSPTMTRNSSRHG